MEHAVSPSLITLGLTADPSSEGVSIRWGLAASFILHALVIMMAMLVRFQSENEQSFRAIDVALISLPAMPMTAPSPKPVPAHTKKPAVAQPQQKIIPSPPAPPVEVPLPPLPTESALERLSESLSGAVNSIIVPQKQEATSMPIPSREPTLQPSEDQASLLENLRLPSTPPTIARPEPLQHAEPLKIPSMPVSPPPATPKKSKAISKPPSQQSPDPTPKVQPAMKSAPVIPPPSLSEVTPFKKSPQRITSHKTLSAPNIEKLLKDKLPDMPTTAPVRHVPKVSRPSKITRNQKLPAPKVSAPPLVKIPESPRSTSTVRTPIITPPPKQRLSKVANEVKDLMDKLKSNTRPPAPKQVSPKRTKPSPATTPSTKPSSPSVSAQQIAKLSIPGVAPVESIKQRLDHMQVQASSDTKTSRQSPAENRYFAMIKEAIDRRWRNPNVPIKNKKVIITFRVEKSGEITSVHVEQSSGNDSYDSAILGAIRKANPLPEFPSDLQKSFLNIKFLFTMPEQ